MSQKENYFLRLMSHASIWLLLSYGIFFAIWTIFFTETGNGDNVEHIHATWLVAYGKMPYRDFFQHHNPLMWYLFAPLIKLYTNQMLILDIFHGVGLLFGILTFFVVYKIGVRFFASKYAVLLSLIVLCPPFFYIYCFNYNPDTFMSFSFSIGLYYFFRYIEKPQLTKLVISFLSFFSAFLFTQKILILLGVLGLLSLYIFVKNKTPISDIFYAALLPIIGMVLFISYLYYNDALGIYYKSNYLFNIHMQEYYGFNKINVVDHEFLIFSSILSILSILIFIKKSDIYFRVFSILFIWELIQRTFYFSIAPYYMLPLMIFSVCLGAKLLDKLEKKNYIFIALILLISTYYAGINKTKYLSVRTQDRLFVKYLMANVTPCDYIISSFLGNQSILTKDPHYYWSLLGHIDIAGDELGIAPKPNLDNLVQIYRPKIISGGIYWNNYYLNRGKQVFAHQVSPKLIEKYYLPTPFNGMYLLKYEYHGKKCHYDKMQKEWIYAE